MESESDKAFQYRVNKKAAHVDGLLREGPQARRFLRETHGFILGLPLVESSAGASPLVIWEKSHEIVRSVFRETFEGIAPDSWGEVDLTDLYLDLRYRIFDECEAVEVYAKPGEAYLLHRLSLHGMTPWQESACSGPDGRMICYFRPEFGQLEDWLYSP